MVGVLLLVALFAIIFYGYPIVKNRYFNSEKEQPSGQSESLNELEIDKPKDNEELFVEDIFEDDGVKEKESGSEIQDKEAFLEIKESDCKNECNDFKKDQENLKYCREVCGLNLPRENVTADDCEEKEGLEEDYCLRDLAISKKDFEICKQIEDKKISENCKNRITEDIIDNSL